MSAFIPDPPALPTREEFDAMPFREAVASVLACCEWTVARYAERIRFRQAQGRELSAENLEDLGRLVASFDALRLQIVDVLEPGASEAALRRALEARLWEAGEPTA